MRARCPPDALPIQKNKKGKQTMKLTKADIKDVRAKLAAKLIEIDRAKKEKDSLEALLADDFRAKRGEYETCGVATEKGILFRKPSYRCSAKPALEVA